MSEKATSQEAATSSANNTIRTSAETVADAEAQRENARHNNPNGFVQPESGVDVKAAEAEFATLQRELSGISQTSRRLSRTQSKQSTKHKGTVGDVEKAVTSESSSEGEQFDLESTLRGNQQAEKDSGIRSKHIGVIWDGLSVSGTGGVTNFVKTFPDAFVSFFNVIETGMNIFGVGKKGRDVKILDDFRGVVQPGEMVLVLGRPGSGCTTFLKGK
jgi:ATPase subunit of ABC transporter with duplicated ATPase domains